MRILWRVWCPYCKHQGTNALPPDNPDFIETINCVTCNKPINARNGKLTLKPLRIKKQEPYDLLEVC